MPLRIPQRRSMALLLALFVAAVVFAVGQTTDEASPMSTIRPGAQAILVVDGVDYEFELDTCFVGHDSFVVAGHGRYENQDFRVLASPSEVELAFGVVDESGPVPDGSSWLRTKDNVRWRTTESKVTARLNLVERLGPNSAQLEAELSVDCGDIS